MMSTVSHGIIGSLKLDLAENGIVQVFQAVYSKEERKDIGVSKALNGVDAGKQLRR